MGPFDGAGVELLGIVFFAAITFVIWLFNKGRAAAEKTPHPIDDKILSVPPAPPGFEHYLACDRCAKETDRLLAREGGPQLCETCFKESFPIINTSAPRDNRPANPERAGG